MQLLNECKKTEKRDFMCVQKTVPKDAYAPLKGVLKSLIQLTNFE